MSVGLNEEPELEHGVDIVTTTNPPHYYHQPPAPPYIDPGIRRAGVSLGHTPLSYNNNYLVGCVCGVSLSGASLCTTARGRRFLCAQPHLCHVH